MARENIYLPNFGRREGDLPPADTAWLFPDRDEDMPVLLFVTDAGTHDPRSNHWKLGWIIQSQGDDGAIVRRLEIVRELGAEHLTNSGPKTKSNPPDGGATKEIPLATLDLMSRRRMETIAAEMPVRRPDGEWNCQNWIISVFEKAEAQGIVTRDQWKRAVDAAVSIGA